MKHLMAVQVAFFEKLKRFDPHPSTLADRISGLLNITRDAVWRRMRGQTQMGFLEYLLLAEYFKVHMNLADTEDTVIFTRGSVKGNPKKVVAMFTSIIHEIARLTPAMRPYYRLASDDLPFFWNFIAPVLIKFKIHYWTHALDNADKVVKNRFDPYAYGADFQPLITQLREYWHSVPSEEVTSMQPLNSLIKQMIYYKDAGLILPEHLHELKMGVHDVIDTIETCSLSGRKTGEPSPATFELYVSEVNLGNQIIIADCQDLSRAYVSLNNYSYLKTENPHFISEHGEWFELVQRKSFLINKVSEKMRKPWFDGLREMVDGV